MKKDNRIAFLTSYAGRLRLGTDTAQITASDFRNFLVSDSTEACGSCDIHPPRRPAPVVIKGEHYCLWCAVEIARDLLEKCL